ncbi:unnamed protein product [Euphydryas editha]|uniref:Uncharacterized protein n=1 Tax=Euphydryas editha TaxID=104508 RepID=A0AAU9U8A8_EUPED|nr:unnamed protein product [Euphydryas editha]
MKLTLIFPLIFYISFTKSTDLDSYEFNRIEFTPLHDAIILNDIVDVLNEFDNNMKFQLNDHTFSNSESDEDIENLLSEYQHYLDKAHDQRINYIRKSKSKNKVPLLRHETFTKLKPFARKNYGENGNYYFEDIKLPTGLNTLIPHDSNIKLVKQTGDLFDTFKSSYDGRKFSNLPKLPSENPSEPILSSCFCKENIIPCKCPCKQCIYTESVLPIKFAMNPFTNSFKSVKYSEDHPSNIFDNNINLRIKIDVQFPNISMLSNVLKYRTRNGFEEHEDMIPKETFSTINLPFPYLNLPIPMDLIGYKQKIFNDKSSPLHKITIHKKKKFRLSNNNKKHKNKKVFTSHSFEPSVHQNITMEYNNNSVVINKNNSLNDNEETKVPSRRNQYETTPNFTSNDMSVTTQNKNSSNQPLKRIYLTINITKGNDSFSESVHKSDNSIETDLGSEKGNESITNLLRIKREMKDKFSKFVTLYANNNTTFSPNNSRSNLSHVPYFKNLDKEAEFNAELLFWPFANKSQSMIPSKNITALILDREIKKSKLNMTSEKIRNNRTTALEKAIFGDVDWNDVDAVVPIFMSFVGKYITGVLTFCSENVCHSMKCAKKICMHRICTPNNRYNNNGHCAGNNDTDSLATMESIMDLPSNIAFEVVDILKEKMLGKLFGKGTLCINSKCSSFAAFKKTFKKSKCLFKELNSTGHCSNLKYVKVL